jgi:hypothetical protein
MDNFRIGISLLRLVIDASDAPSLVIAATMRIFHNVRVIARLQIRHATHFSFAVPSIRTGAVDRRPLTGAVISHVTVRSKLLAVPRATLKRIGVVGFLRCPSTVQ